MWWWVAGIVLGANVAHAKKDPLEKVEDLCKGLSFDQRPRLEAGSFASQVAAPPVLPSRLNAMLTMGMLSTGCFSMRVTTQGRRPSPSLDRATRSAASSPSSRRLRPTRPCR